MDRFEISTLRVYYGSLLTSKQNEMIRLRYDLDLSYGEVAQMCDVSRQAVLDSINKGVEHLVEFEQKLGLVARDAKIHPLLNGIEAENNGSNDKIGQYVRQIKRILEE